MHHHLYLPSPFKLWSAALLLLLLAACGSDAGPGNPDYSNQEGAEVSIFANLGRSSQVASQGVPTNPETGETGVSRAELEVYSGATRLFFKDGRIVDEAQGEAVVLTPSDSDVTLALPEGTYRFALTAFDERESANVLAEGEVEQQVGENSRVSIPLTSLVGSARFRVPESVKANEVFDAFLEVSPPNRPDLRVPLGDFTTSYEVGAPSVQLEGSSNLGVRVAAACEVVTVSATVDNDLSEIVSASAEIRVDDEACDDQTDVGADLVPPFIDITTPEADSTVNTAFTLQGDVNDQQSGVDKVEVYEGTVKLGEAELDGDAMTWSFDASLDNGKYTLVAVAFDRVGNTSRAEVEVTVKEGAGEGDGGETCTNPVNIPDEVLEGVIRDALGKGSGDLTCSDLAGLVELLSDNDGIRNLEGLQYALNLETLLLSNRTDDPDGNNVTDLTPLSNLTKLDRLDIEGNGLSSLAGLQGLNLTQIDAADNSIEDLSPLSNLTQLNRLLLDNNNISDLAPLSGLGNLETLFLFGNQIGDLSPLATLENLSSINLGQNKLTDIQPLVDNSGLGGGDSVVLTENPTLDACPGSEARADIEMLQGRGVDVVFNTETCEGGDNGSSIIEVTTTSDAASLEDECTLRAAITAANTDQAVGGCVAGSGADTIDLVDTANLVEKTYTLTEVDNETEGSNALPAITSKITLRGGQGLNVTTTVERAEDAPGFRLLYIAEEGNLTIEGVTLRNGLATDSPTRNSGGGIFNAGTLTMQDASAVQDSSAPEGGGIDNQGAATIRNSSVDGNTTGAGRGGGIFNAGTLTLEGTSLTSNFESEGAGFYNTGTLTMQGGRVESNTSPGTASAFVNAASGVAELRGVEIRDNGDDGGTVNNFGELTLIEVVYEGNSDGISNFEEGTLTLIDSTVSGTGGNYGPGLNNEGVMRVESSTVSENALGGVVNRGTAEIISSTVQGSGDRDNDESADGVVNVEGGTLTLSESTVVGTNGNGVVNSGAAEITTSTIKDNGPFKDGVINNEGGTLILTRSLIDGNGSFGVVNGGAMTFTNNTVLDNYTGGVSNLETGTLDVAFSTIFGYGSGFVTSIINGAEQDAVTVFGTILDTETGFDCSSDALTSRGYNYFVNDKPCSFNQESDIVSESNPRNRVQDNGGPTLTAALKENSAAIDHIPTDVCDAETDQRGVSRPQGEACDIGAFELE